MPHRWRSGAMGCGVRHAGCARLRRAGEGAGERESGESGEAGDSRERDSIADGTALRNIVGEEVAATFGDTEDLFPEGSLFMSLRAIGYLLTHAACLLSVRQKNVGTKRRPQDVRFTELLIKRGKKKIRSVV